MAFIPNEKQLDILLTNVCNALAERGYAIVENALPQQLADALHAEALQLKQEKFIDVGTGRNQDRHVDKKVRADAISWFEPDTETSRAYLDVMEGLRSGINRVLYLGLFEYECHYAKYEPGAFYRTHLDAFGGKRNRVLSTIYYLNPRWAHADQGELVLYAPDAKAIVATIAPMFNTMVFFFSERFPHEVLPTTQLRHSVAGWFRINTRGN